MIHSIYSSLPCFKQYCVDNGRVIIGIIEVKTTMAATTTTMVTSIIHMAIFWSALFIHIWDRPCIHFMYSFARRDHLLISWWVVNKGPQKELWSISVFAVTIQCSPFNVNIPEASHNRMLSGDNKTPTIDWWCTDAFDNQMRVACINTTLVCYSFHAQYL